MKFLGTGNAFPYDLNLPPEDQNFQSNAMLIAPSGRKLLIDAGGLIQNALGFYQMSSADLDSVYISHPHGDHIGGLEYIAFTTYFNPTLPKPRLIANKKLVRELWNNSLSGGLGSIQGQITDLDTFFNVDAVGKNQTFRWSNIDFQPVQVVHYMDGFDIVPSYGLFWEVNDKKYFFTSDTQHCPNQIKDFYNVADLIFQDCETAPFPSGVHAHYTELVTLPDDIKAKMHLYHYHPGEKPDCVTDGFAGWITRGQEFIL